MSARKFELRPRKFGNIRVEANADLLEVRLHGNLIASVNMLAGWVRVSSCGWRTRTTATALNTLFKLLQSPMRVFSHRGDWYVSDESGRSEFYDNMTLNFNPVAARTRNNVRTLGQVEADRLPDWF